ncbi:MAG: hypothetical protein IBX40_09090 [Methanosarcinales archaeon]|nr:hypothetical protein [Methanosarcinales archaeon]
MLSRKISVSLCSGKTAFEVNVFTGIDLKRAGKILKAKVITPQIIIFDHGEAEVSLFPAGRMLVKHVKTEDEALQVAKTMLETINGQ